MFEHPIDPAFCASGAALCLLGWTLYWGGLHALGAAAGLAAGAALGWFACEAGNYQAHLPAILGAGGGFGAIVGIFLFRRLHFWALALIGAVLGAAGGLRIVSIAAAGGQAVWAQSDGAVALAAAVGAACGGLFFLFLHRFVIILVTSAAGAILLGQGIPMQNPFLVPAVAFVMALAFQGGIVHRFGLSRSRREAPVASASI